MSKTTTHDIALVNMKDGSVQGHKAGCGDLKRGTKKFADEPWALSVADKAEARAAYNADFDQETDGWYEIEWLPCAKHVPAGETPSEQPVEAASTADEAAAAEFTAEPATEAKIAADATYAARGNYNTVWVPLALSLSEHRDDVRVWVEKASAMLVNVHIAGAEATPFLRVLEQVESGSLAALKAWQKTQDRKGLTDMEKYNQNRSFLAGYGAAVAKRTSGARKMPTVAFAKDMERAARPDAFKAGAAAAHKEAKA